MGVRVSVQSRFGAMTAGAVLLMGFSSPATAQQPQVAPGLVDALAKCLDIADDARRLACHDAAARALVEASRKREVVVVDREEVKKTRRSLFGFPLPRIKLFGGDGPDQGETIDRIEAKITRVANLGYGKYRLTLEDGAVWTTTDTWRGNVLPEVGAVLQVKRAALGSYMVEVRGGRSVRAIRSQ